MTEQFEVVLIIKRTRSSHTNIYWHEWLNKFLQKGRLHARVTEQVYASNNIYRQEGMNMLTQIVTFIDTSDW